MQGQHHNSGHTLGDFSGAVRCPTQHCTAPLGLQLRAGAYGGRSVMGSCTGDEQQWPRKRRCAGPERHGLVGLWDYGVLGRSCWAASKFGASDLLVGTRRVWGAGTVVYLHHIQEGGGDFGGSQLCVRNFALQIGREISHTKQSPGASAKLAPVAKLLQACKALHTTAFLGVSAKFTAQNPGAAAKFPAAQFPTANLTWHGILPPSLL